MPKELLLKNMRHLIQKKKLTQEEFSLKLGYSRAAASHWLRRRSAPGLDTIVEIADLFKVSVESLCRRDLTKNHLP